MSKKWIACALAFCMLMSPFAGALAPLRALAEEEIVVAEVIPEPVNEPAPEPKPEPKPEPQPTPQPQPKPTLPQTSDDTVPVATAEVLAATGAAVLLAGLSLRLTRRHRED